MMVKIAQVGVGYWGPNLLRNIVQNKRCNVLGVADLSEERRNFVNNLYPAIRVTDNIDELISDPEIQALVIATPVQTHFDIAVKALENGKHILVEKPLARSVAEVEAIEQVAKRNNLTVMVGHTFLFNPAVRYVKQLIDTEQLGDLRYIYSQRLNLGRIRSDVDALWNFAPHDISIIQYWLNDPEPVSIVRRGIDYIQPGIEDVVFLNIMYADKVMANIHVSWLDPTRIRSMVIVGSKKMVIYDDTAENKIAIYDKGIDRKAVLGENMDFDRQSFATYDYRSGDVFLPKINFQEPLKLEIDHFIDCIQSGTECLTGILHAKRVVGILEKAGTTVSSLGLERK
jgi:predicted dehydrogenase